MWWSQPTPMPHPTIWTPSCPTSTPPTGRRWRPSGISRRWPSPCSAGSTPGRPTSPTRSGRWPPGAWPAWASTPRRRRSGWPTTAASGSSPPTPAGGAWPRSRSRGSTPRWPFRARCSPVACPRPCTWVARPARGSRWCGPPCTPTTAGWRSSALLLPGAGPPASPSTSTTWTAPWRRSPGSVTPASSGGSCCRPCRSSRACPATPTSTTSRSGVRARTTTWWSTCTPGPRAPPPTPSSSTTTSMAASSGSTRSSSSPGVRCGS